MVASTYIAFTGRMINKYEGGYGWNRKDTGGPTKYGITCYDLAAYMGQRMDSMSRWAPIVQSMTLATAEAIYKTKYAAALQYDRLPAGVDACVMDYGVNSGVARPPIVLRAILHVKGSGPIDSALLAAIEKADPKTLINAICAERLQFMHAIRGGSAWAEFGGGWGARVADLKAYCDHLATVAASQPSVEPVAPDLTKTSLPKAVHGSPSTGVTTIKTAVATSAASAPASSYAGLPHYLVAGLVGTIVLGSIGAYFYQKQAAVALNATVTPPITLPPVAVAAA